MSSLAARLAGIQPTAPKAPAQRWPDDDRVVFNPNAKLDTSGFQVRGLDQGVKADPSFSTDPVQLRSKLIHGPSFISPNDPNYTSDQIRQIQEAPQRPDIPPTKGRKRS